ncbi:hypothetical protein ACETAC_01390 [Aceticella autotrophica]|uniref:Uncharacterized protein n=1 Tax=Aceticella autotrophica TaxID=2755338 RepID=A0A975GAY5_9THEO|nr:hypothetical protein [Aceticella autotrophica]QSZ27597.1 hypothetical protein ACETAC_01390 [Aceticella autotrophica]
MKDFLIDEDGNILQGVIWTIVGVIVAAVFLQYILPGLRSGVQKMGNALSGN